MSSRKRNNYVSIKRKVAKRIKLAEEENIVFNLIHPIESESSCEKLSPDRKHKKSSSSHHSSTESESDSDEFPKVEHTKSYTTPVLPDTNGTFMQQDVVIKAKEEATLITMMKILFQSIDELKEEMKVLSERQAELHREFQEIKPVVKADVSLMLSTTPLPEGISLPIEEDSELIALNNRLRKDESLQINLAHYLCGQSSSNTFQLHLLSITKMLLTTEVASLYSRLGRKGKKCFEKLRELFNVIIAAVFLKFPDVSREDIEERFGQILAQAPDWIGKKLRKVKRHEQRMKRNSSNSL